MPLTSSVRLAMAGFCCALSVSLRAPAQDLFPPAGNAATFPHAVDRSATLAAREELRLARLNLLRARLASTQVSRTIESQLRGGHEYRELQRSAASAYAYFNAVRQPILLTLRRDDEYARLNRERETARQTIRRLADAEKASYLQLLPYAKQALEAGRRMTRAEVIALALDPAVEDARSTMVEAFARLRYANLTAAQAAAAHPGVAMARDELQAAKDRVTAASRRLAEALAAEAAAERMR